MTTRSLAALLVDFGPSASAAAPHPAHAPPLAPPLAPTLAPAPARQTGAAPSPAARLPAFDPDPPAAPAGAPANGPENRAAALARARAEGAAEARAALLAEIEARRPQEEAEQQARVEAALAQARALWVKAQGEALAERIREAFGTLRNDVEDGVAAALRPLAETGAAREAARLMADEIARLLSSGGGGDDDTPVEIVGPADLIDAVRDALETDPRVGPTPAAQGRLRFVEAENVDAFARLGRVSVETRLAAFARALREGA